VLMREEVQLLSLSNNVILYALRAHINPVSHELRNAITVRCDRVLPVKTGLDAFSRGRGFVPFELRIILCAIYSGVEFLLLAHGDL
jgi:hypothetical protein